MGKVRKIEVGDLFVIGTETVTVVHYQDSQNVWVEGKEGNRKVVRALDLWDGSVKWRRADGSFCPGRRQELATSFAHATPKKVSRRYAVGQVWQSNSYGPFTIEELDGKLATIRWHSDGSKQSNVYTSAIGKGEVANRVADPRGTPRGHYVFVVHDAAGKVVFVGRGTGFRYRQALSSSTVSRGLKTLIASGVQLTSSVHRDNMGEDAAKRLKSELIAAHRPIGNRAACGM